MKKIILFTTMISIWALSSCGTASYYASDYEDGIYYRPSESSRSAQIKDQKELESLSRTTQNRRMSGYLTDTILLSKDNNSVDIAYIPNSSYVLLLDGESYEDRLNKFNDSTYSYSVNLVMEDSYYNNWGTPYSWWGGGYGPYSNNWYGWGGPYFGMSFGGGYGWGSGWGSGWSFGWGGGWNNPWYGGWGSGWYGHGYPWYPHYPNYYPSYGGNRREVYYGRDTSPSSGNRGGIISNVRGGGTRPSSLNQLRGTSPSGDRLYSTGSSGRRSTTSTSGTSSGRRGVYSGGNNTALYNKPAIRPTGSRSSSVTGSSKYRRSATTTPRSSTSSNSSYNRSSDNNRSTSTYNRGSNQNNNSQVRYNRSSNSNTSSRSSYSSSSTNRSSSSSSSSSRSSSSGSSTRSSGGGRR